MNSSDDVFCYLYMFAARLPAAACDDDVYTISSIFGPYKIQESCKDKEGAALPNIIPNEVKINVFLETFNKQMFLYTKVAIKTVFFERECRLRLAHLKL